jgi:hypothetical protein
MNKRESILYAQLAVHNIQKNGKTVDIKNINIFMNVQYELYPVIEMAEEKARQLGIMDVVSNTEISGT